MPLKMPKAAKNKPLSESELEAWESSRNLGAELLASVQEMLEDKGQVVLSPLIHARKQSGLTQAKFATLLGVSVRTLQSWEQGTKKPSGAAKTLIRLVSINPAVLHSLADAP